MSSDLGAAGSEGHEANDVVSIQTLAKEALRNKFVAATGVEPDSKGYVRLPQENLVPVWILIPFKTISCVGTATNWGNLSPCLESRRYQLARAPSTQSRFSQSNDSITTTLCRSFVSQPDNSASEIQFQRYLHVPFAL